MVKNGGVVRKRAILIDVDYKIMGGKTVVRLLMRGKRLFRLYDNYEPYFYCDAPESAGKEILAVKALGRDRTVSPVKCEWVKMNVLGHEKEIWKVIRSGKQKPMEIGEEKQE